MGCSQPPTRDLSIRISAEWVRQLAIGVPITENRRCFSHFSLAANPKVHRSFSYGGNSGRGGQLEYQGIEPCEPKAFLRGGTRAHLFGVRIEIRGLVNPPDA